MEYIFTKYIWKLFVVHVLAPGEDDFENGLKRAIDVFEKWILSNLDFLIASFALPLILVHDFGSCYHHLAVWQTLSTFYRRLDQIELSHPFQENFFVAISKHGQHNLSKVAIVPEDKNHSTFYKLKWPRPVVLLSTQFDIVCSV